MGVLVDFFVFFRVCIDLWLRIAYSALQNLRQRSSRDGVISPNLSEELMRRCRSGEDGQSTWYFFLLLCCGANLALAIVLGNMNYRQAVKWSCHKSSMQVSRTDLLIQSKISKQLCLCLLEIRWGHVKGFRRCGFDEEVRAIVQSRTNMVPFMDVNNMNDYDMVNPAESKGVSKTNLLVFHLSTNICD